MMGTFTRIEAKMQKIERQLKETRELVGKIKGIIKADYRLNEYKEDKMKEKEYKFKHMKQEDIKDEDIVSETEEEHYRRLAEEDHIEKMRGGSNIDGKEDLRNYLKLLGLSFVDRESIIIRVISEERKKVELLKYKFAKFKDCDGTWTGEFIRAEINKIFGDELNGKRI